MGAFGDGGHGGAVVSERLAEKVGEAMLRRLRDAHGRNRLRHRLDEATHPGGSAGIRVHGEQATVAAALPGLTATQEV